MIVVYVSPMLDDSGTRQGSHDKAARTRMIRSGRW